MLKTLLTITSVSLGLLFPAAAWAQSNSGYLPEIEAEVVPGWRRADGVHVAAVRIQMQDGWKTYWRTPGDGGIPPRFDFSGSRNLSSVQPMWPAPRVFVDNGMKSFGYLDALLLPILVVPRQDGRDVVVKSRLDIGVCKEICVPMTVSVKGSLDHTQTAIISEIAAAMIAQPFTAAEARVSEVSCSLRPSDDGMKVSAEITMPPAGSSEEAVIETDNPELWVQDADVVRRGGKLTVSSEIMHAEGKPFFLQRNGLRITVLGSDYAVDIQGCSTG